MPSSWISSPARRFWQSLALVYLSCLSWMLFTPDPWILFGTPVQRLAEQFESTLADHFQHAAAFLLLAILGHLALGGRKGEYWPIQAACLLGYALAAEGSHTLIPNRYFEWSDLLANLAGVLIGMLLAGLLLHSSPSPDP